MDKEQWAWLNQVFGKNGGKLSGNPPPFTSLGTGIMANGYSKTLAGRSFKKFTSLFFPSGLWLNLCALVKLAVMSLYKLRHN